jgi:S-adenosylmethionine decarboxylase
MSEKIVGFVTDGDECYAGKHLLIDFFDCDNHGSMEEISKIMVESCKATGATVLFDHLHPFPGGGVSGAVILAESHCTCHSWPEVGFVALDIFVCGTCDPYKAIPILRDHFKPKIEKITLVKRGMM